MDTSGDPGNKISALQHSKQCKITFFPHRCTGVPVWPRAQIAGPRRCSRHSLSSCWQDQERNTEAWWESSVAWERFSLFYRWNSSTDIHVSHDYNMPFRSKDATKTHHKKITVLLFTDDIMLDLPTCAGATSCGPAPRLTLCWTVADVCALPGLWPAAHHQSLPEPPDWVVGSLGNDDLKRKKEAR